MQNNSLHSHYNTVSSLDDSQIQSKLTEISKTLIYNKFQSLPNVNSSSGSFCIYDSDSEEEIMQDLQAAEYLLMKPSSSRTSFADNEMRKDRMSKKIPFQNSVKRSGIEYGENENKDEDTDAAEAEEKEEEQEQDEGETSSFKADINSKNYLETNSNYSKFFDDDEKKEKDATYEVTISGVRFRARPSSCIFVASLSNARSENDLFESVSTFFQKWGDISVKVLKDEKQRPYSFVQFTNDKDAKHALEQAQGALLDDRPIRCEPARVNRTIHISNKSGLEISYDSVVRMCEEFGELELVIASNDNLDDLNLRSRSDKKAPAWFIQFVFREEAICAFLHFLESSSVDTEWAENIQLPQNEGPISIDKAAVFVGQLSSSVTEQKFVERFEQHGKIKSYTFIDRSSSPFGFVKYEKEVSAARAVERENHAVFMNKTMHVQYKELHPKENRTVNKISKQPRLVVAHPPVGTNSKVAFNRRRFVANGRMFGVNSRNQLSHHHHHYHPHQLENFHYPYRQEYLNYKPYKPLNIHDGPKPSSPTSRMSRQRKRSSPTSSAGKSTFSHNYASKSIYSGTSFTGDSVTEEDTGSYLGNQKQDGFMPRVLPMTNSTPFYSYNSYKSLPPPPPQQHHIPPMSQGQPPKSSYFNYAPYNYYGYGDGSIPYLPPPPPPADANQFFLYYPQGSQAPPPSNSGKFSYPPMMANVVTGPALVGQTSPVAPNNGFQNKHESASPIDY
ncbi:Rim4 protein [Saccharomycopsis crataegensis]|uniref:Rim4 protein n=1 Tax=Saccharomycopsis crataegensis TaxID=43959 RepID=A0AAV5QGS4_9ASCO|nr:Rim4 protein [Saccharomycopsis crataegensis]